jgi:hypothetical protein
VKDKEEVQGKVKKVKLTIEEAMKAQRGLKVGYRSIFL